MPRALVLSNGNLSVTFDADLVLREIYYPMVGMLEHVQGKRNKMGVWADGSFSWIDSPSWEKEPAYDECSLVGASRARNRELGIEMFFADCVHFRHDLLLREIRILNGRPGPRSIAVVFVNDLQINESDIGDTAYYDPQRMAVIHYKRGRTFLFSGCAGDGGPPFQVSTAQKPSGMVEGASRDAEDGYLACTPIAHGAVDSAVSFRLDLAGGESAVVHYWMAAAETTTSALALNDLVRSRGARALIEETRGYWRQWLSKARVVPSGLSQQAVRLYWMSLLLTRAHQDKRGGFIASTDRDIMKTHRDHYCYVWHRDAALAAHALSVAGYHECVRRFLEFCEATVTEEGFFWPKYHADGSMGSTWHPRTVPNLPIQEDETALVAFVAGEHLRNSGEQEFTAEIYPGLIRKVGRFLETYRDATTGLPLPSYDLWEERRGVFAWTCAWVYRGLDAVADIADVMEPDIAPSYRRAARRVRDASLEHLVNPAIGRLIRGYVVTGPDAGGLSEDPTVDSSIYGAVSAGLLDPLDEVSLDTLAAVQSSLAVKSRIGGWCRYPGDWYMRVSDDLKNVPGNPWFICSLWLASWLIAIATTPDELNRPREIVEWVARHASSTGVLAEQMNPYDGSALSVAPLTWSHSTYVKTCIDLELKSRLLGVVGAETI